MFALCFKQESISNFISSFALINPITLSHTPTHTHTHTHTSYKLFSILKLVLAEFLFSLLILSLSFSFLFFSFFHYLFIHWFLLSSLPSFFLLCLKILFFCVEIYRLAFFNFQVWFNLHLNVLRPFFTQSYCKKLNWKTKFHIIITIKKLLPIFCFNRRKFSITFIFFLNLEWKGLFYFIFCKGCHPNGLNLKYIVFVIYISIKLSGVQAF